MTDLSDPYEVLASIPDTLKFYAQEADREAADARIRAEAYRRAEREADRMRRSAEEWRPKTVAAPFVLDDAARERAYAVAISRTNLMGNWDREEDIRQLVDEIFDAAAGTREAG